MHTIAFYNLENLFDTKNNPLKNDADFLPHSKLGWTKKRYYNKLRKLGFAISEIGKEKALNPPDIIGLAEVENAKVLKDLAATKFLKPLDYSYVHFNSPDERGIDVGMLYNPKVFHVETAAPVLVEFTNESNDYTRDILMVTGRLKNNPMHLLINHWPSRREGTIETAPKRLITSKKVSELIKRIRRDGDKLIVMGDFNDGPSSESITQLVSSNDLFNPMAGLLSYSRGSLKYKGKWLLFDQILISTDFFATDAGHLSFETADIFDADFLKEYKGRHKGAPFRTYAGEKYLGGYSDHFPVYITLKLNT